MRARFSRQMSYLAGETREDIAPARPMYMLIQSKSYNIRTPPVESTGKVDGGQ